MKKSLILLSGLVAANVAPLEARPVAERPAFSVRAECFDALPGDRVATEATEKGSALRWNIRYPLRENRALTKRVSAGLLRDTDAMSLWIRGDGRHELGLQMVEDNGRGFTKLIHVEPCWNQLRLPFADFQPNQEANVPISPERINRLVLVDYAATLSPQKRARSIWLADWKFNRSESAKTATAPSPVRS